MTREQAIAKIERVEKKYAKIRELRESCDKLIRCHIPEQWNDGDVRVLNRQLYRTLESKILEALELEGRLEARNCLGGRLALNGQFGTLYFEESKHV